jgi:class 3 adenylate cyclase
MRCRKCETENLADSTFCVECGAKLESGCPACGSENPSSAKFCRKCGTALFSQDRTPDQYTPAHLAEKILSSKAALLGERKQVTVLFADVKGSMDLQEQLDAESWSRIMDRFFTLLCEGVHRYEGTVNKFTGDGIMALFGAPISHEDHALRACYAGMQITRDVGEYAKELRRDQGLSFSVRLGINSGEVVLGTVGDDLRSKGSARFAPAWTWRAPGAFLVSSAVIRSSARSRRHWRERLKVTVRSSGSSASRGSGRAGCVTNLPSAAAPKV